MVSWTRGSWVSRLRKIGRFSYRLQITNEDRMVTIRTPRDSFFLAERMPMSWPYNSLLSYMLRDSCLLMQWEIDTNAK